MSRNNLPISDTLDSYGWGEYNKKREDDKMLILDEATPVITSYINRLTRIEQSIIYYLIFSEGVKKYLTKRDLPKKITNFFLSKKLREESKKTSVYLKRLVDDGDIVREALNEKNFVYGVENILLIDWFKMRNAMSREWFLTDDARSMIGNDGESDYNEPKNLDH